MNLYLYYFSLSSEDFLNVVDAAGYGIGYWATSATVNRDDPTEPYYSVVAEGETYKITRDDLETTMSKVFAGKFTVCEQTRNSVGWAVREKEYGEIDAGDADSLVQLAAFGEIIYG